MLYESSCTALSISCAIVGRLGCEAAGGSLQRPADRYYGKGRKRPLSTQECIISLLPTRPPTLLPACLLMVLLGHLHILRSLPNRGRGGAIGLGTELCPPAAAPVDGLCVIHAGLLRPLAARAAPMFHHGDAARMRQAGLPVRHTHGIEHSRGDELILGCGGRCCGGWGAGGRLFLAT